MAELRRMKDTSSLTLDDAFLSEDGIPTLLTFDPDRDTELVEAETDLSRLDELTSILMSRYPRHDTAIDAEIAIELHRCLPISRRLAADGNLWAWLGVVKYPSFVAWRWRKSKGRDGIERRNRFRFMGDPVRQTFARLWWAAELTIDESGDYTLSKQLLSLARFQDGYEAMFGRTFCQYQPALAEFINVVGPKSQKMIREVSKEFGYIMTTLVLEALTQVEIEVVLKEIVERVERKLAAESTPAATT